MLMLMLLMMRVGQINTLVNGTKCPLAQPAQTEEFVIGADGRAGLGEGRVDGSMLMMTMIGVVVVVVGRVHGRIYLNGDG